MHGTQREGSADFAMQVPFSGVLLPLLGRFLPNFGPVFESF
jgi:hypothetical protein